MKPVVIDCCAGAYEALGLYLAGKSGLDVRAVTANSLFEDERKTCGELAGLCAAFGIKAPVVAGATQPLIAGLRPMEDRYPRLPAGLVEGGEIKPGYAWDEIYAQAVAAGGKLTLVCLGPLTNLAIALFKYPELRELLAEVVFFGGALDWGNVSQTAEANLAADPHAADALSKSGIKTTMLPWSECCRAGFGRAALPAGNRVLNTVLDELERSPALPLEAPFVLNHALAVLYAAGCEGFETKMHIIRIETRSSLCMGRSCPNLMYSLKKDPPNMNVVRGIDTAAVSGTLGGM